jgi:guanylate kinase
MEEQTILTALHGAVASYAMPDEAKSLATSSDLLLLCGVTAAGKNTIASYLIEHANFEAVVSHTTRAPRLNHGILEESGREYWFVNPAQMLELVQKKAFLEVKAVHGDTCYGTSIASVQKAVTDGKRPVMEIDVQGALELTQAIPSLRPIFILPPSYEVWMERLGTRGSISDGEKMRRLRSASMEIQTALDHPSFLLVVNHEVNFTAQELIQGIQPDGRSQHEARELALELMQYLR